ncbi:unnamed protein product [Schistosoma margrebowiei]|uniref:acid phosphatase n=1 Tax=Schistosoma margrebowiei TaxID=48269 RepID=A0AA85A8B8_9TREM|nr:unnamed protein product [Schistosoma margrebowiei]
MRNTNKLKSYLVLLQYIILNTSFYLCEGVNGEDLLKGKVLRHVHLIYSHGDSSPAYRIPQIYPNFEGVWPEGTDKLTNIGIQQQFILGRWMRMNYLTFVPQKYNSSTYHLRSTDADKTLMSAMASSAGFYWQSSSPFDGSKLHWSSVPVHEVSKEKYVKSSSEIIRLEIGLFLHHIIQHIYSIIQGKSIYISNNITLSNKHLMVYSITNHHFAYLLNAFGILNNNNNNNKPIEYASVISLELYGPSILSKNNNNNQYILKILYKNGWIDDIGHYVILPICKKFNYFYDCPLNLIIKQLNTFTINPQFYINECSLILDQLINNNNNNNNNNLYEFLPFNLSMRINFVIFILNFILVIILWSFVIYFKKLEKTKKENNKTKILEQLINK